MARFLRHVAEVVRVLVKGDSGLKARILEMDAEAARVSLGWLAVLPLARC